MQENSNPTKRKKASIFDDRPDARKLTKEEVFPELGNNYISTSSDSKTKEVSAVVIEEEEIMESVYEGREIVEQEEEYELDDSSESDNESFKSAISANPVNEVEVALHSAIPPQDTIVTSEAVNTTLENESFNDMGYSDEEYVEEPAQPSPVSLRSETPIRDRVSESPTVVGCEAPPPPPPQIPVGQLSTTILSAIPPPPAKKQKYTAAARKKWTDEETNTLEEGLWRFKAPRWKKIEQWAGERLQGRDNVQIKDRARTVMKALVAQNVDVENTTAYKYVLHPEH